MSQDNISEKEKALTETIKNQEQEIARLNDLKKTDDLFPGARKQKTFEGAFKNGYEDGTVERANKKQKEKLALEATVEQ